MNDNRFFSFTEELYHTESRWTYSTMGVQGCSPHLAVSSTPLEKSSTTLKNLLDHSTLE
jgi:hypothetical protein